VLTAIEGVLDEARLGAVREILAGAGFIDGRTTAGRDARRVKNNLELPVDDPRLAQLNNLVMGALVRHPRYRSAALPLRVAAPYYARYVPGMAYGEHVDDPIMQAESPYRSDIACTIFLSGPADYDGGELVVNTSFGEQSVKLPAGAAVLYPASSRHRVAEVTRGERLVAVTWIQSVVRDPERRALLDDLNQARESLGASDPDGDATARVNHTYVNLVRMWAEL